MNDKTIGNTSAESTQNSFYKLKPWHTVESAASLLASGQIVKGEEWHDNAEIQAAYKALYDEAYKVEEHLQDKMLLGDMFEWVKNNPHVAEEMKKYPDVTYQSLLDVMQRIFYFNDCTYKTFNEICAEFYNEYRATSFCNETVTDLENYSAYKHPSKEEHASIAEGRFRVMANAILAEADKFCLSPRFTSDEETKPDYFYFYPVSYKPDTPKGCLEVSTEGIKAWLEYNKIHDQYYNPVSKKSKDALWDILDPEGNCFPKEIQAQIRAWREITNPGSKHYFKKYGEFTLKQVFITCLRENAESWHLIKEERRTKEQIERGVKLPEADENKLENIAAMASWNKTNKKIAQITSGD